MGSANTDIVFIASAGRERGYKAGEQAIQGSRSRYSDSRHREGSRVSSVAHACEVAFMMRK